MLILVVLVCRTGQDVFVQSHSATTMRALTESTNQAGHSMTSTTFTDILHAKQTIARYLSPTPLANYPALDKLCGTRILVKHENQQLTGAFKVRGGINLISQLSAEERKRGVITASTGNHGQSIAHAVSLFGVRATVVAPEKSNPLKVAAIRDLGAEVLFYGADFDAAREHCEMLSKR